MADFDRQQDEAPGRGMRLAFVGAGHWHFAVDARYLDLARAAGCEVVGVSDDDETTARRRAEQAGCSWTTDPVDLVERFKPDVVMAMPRPDRAPSQVRALLDLGVPLLAEKPLGLRATDVWPLVEPAERGWVAVAFPNRYLSIWEHVDRLREAGELEPIAHLHLRLVKGTARRYREFGVPWMLEPALAGGGPIRNFGVHFADLITWQLGTRAAQVVGAATYRSGEFEIEDFGAAVLRTADGTVATIEMGYTHAVPSGTDLEVRVAGRGAHLTQRPAGLEVLPASGSPFQAPASGPSAYHEYFFDSLRRLRAGRSPRTTVRDCALANEIVDAVYDAAQRAASGTPA